MQMRQALTVLTVVMIILVTGVEAAQLATGVVFSDLDRDGVRDRGEPGVTGVPVSNGCEVVLSDGQGRYWIPVEEGTVLFISKPSGWAVPVDESNLPQFFYRYNPAGSKQFYTSRFQGVDPTGPLPVSVDFALYRQEEPVRFKVVWLADTQTQSAAELDFLRDDVIAELIGTDAAFGVTVGDIVYDDLSLLPRYSRLMSAIGIPWYNVPGNHDVNHLAPTDRLSLETFKRIFGPPYYSFDYGQVHFVVLDTVIYLGSDQDRDEPHPRGAGSYIGGVDQQQLRWLAADLAQVPVSRPVVVTMHIPLRSSYDPELPRINVDNREEVLATLSGHQRVKIIAGHMHTVEHLYFGKDDGVVGQAPVHQLTLGAVSGTWWSGPLDERGIPAAMQADGTPRGYYVMEVDGSDLRVRFKAAGKAESHQMRLSFDSLYHGYSPNGIRYLRRGEATSGRMTRDHLFATELVVNLFNGGPNSRVSYQIGSHASVVMMPKVRHDPFVDELFLGSAATWKDFVKPDDCLHLWTARLPADLEAGAHPLTVSAVDEYGHAHILHRVLEVEN
jgi:hypothetical protein